MCTRRCICKTLGGALPLWPSTRGGAPLLPPSTAQCTRDTTTAHPNAYSHSRVTPAHAGCGMKITWQAYHTRLAHLWLSGCQLHARSTDSHEPTSLRPKVRQPIAQGPVARHRVADPIGLDGPPRPATNTARHRAAATVNLRSRTWHLLCRFDLEVR